MNSTEASKSVVRNYLSTRDWSNLSARKALFAEDATWTLIGDLPMSGTWHGHKGIFEDFLGLAFSRIDTATLDLTVTELIAEGDKVVLEWTSKAQVHGGGSYDQHCLAIFTVRDGVIASVREYFDTEHARHALFSA
jgi:ketosteroid isomerase-like protein